jgi:hypothetical protein
MVVNITTGDPTKMPPFNPNASAHLGSFDYPGYLFSTYETGFTNLVLTSTGEWLRFSIPKYAGWEASISLCYDSYAGMDLQVNMSTNGVISEPTLTLFNKTTNHFSTEQVQTQLDFARNHTDTMALSTTVGEMHSQISPSYDAAVKQNQSSLYVQNWIPSYLQGVMPVKFFYIMCESCTSSDTTPTIGNFSSGRFGQYNTDQSGSQYYVKGATQQIFMDAVQSTNDIGLALSDYMTLLARMLYYDTLPYFDLADQVTTHQFESGLFPKRFTGLIVVLAALLVHVCIVTATTIVFLTRTHVSRIGDAAWQVIAQVQLQELRGLLPEALMATDASFEKRLTEAGMGNNIASFSSEVYETKKSG